MRPSPASPRHIALAALLFVAACAQVPKGPQPEALILQPASFAQLPGWRADNTAEALEPLQKSCALVARKDPAQDFGAAGKVADWLVPCAALEAVPAGDGEAARAYFETYFTPMRATSNGDADGLFTGYYEPSLRGARMRGGPYQYPLYARPDDLVTADLGLFLDSLAGQRVTGRVQQDAKGKIFVPYAKRAEIAALGVPARALAWVDDPVGAFFLEIQGSGRIELDDGTVMHAGYAIQNGHPYTAVGRAMRDDGLFAEDEKITMQKIRAWLSANPQTAQSVMNKNESYVFFEEREAEGAVGAQGVVLTPLRSAAVDRHFIAYGTPLWLDIESPEGPGMRIQRLVIAQDTGGAIKGPVRGDLFWGHGARAEEMAGVMQSRGGYWMLVPKNAAR